MGGLESDQYRLGIARQYGCEAIVGDASEWARERDGLGADVVIDAAGVSAALKVAVDLVRPSGQITKVGWGPTPLHSILDLLVQKDVNLHGRIGPTWHV